MSPAIVPFLEILVDIWRTRRFVREEVIPLIETANGLPDRNERRELVVRVLMDRGLTESRARYLVEKGVQLWKRREAKRKKKAARAAAKALRS